MCRFESQKDMKCVQFDVKVFICEMLFLTCIEHTSTISPELMKLRIIITSKQRYWSNVTGFEKTLLMGFFCEN